MSRRAVIKYFALGLGAVAVSTQLQWRWPQAIAQTQSSTQYSLSITEALFEMVDANRVYMWAFKDLDTVRNPSQLPQVPGPVLQATAGGTLTIQITNNLPQQHAFAIPGLFTSAQIPPGTTTQLSIPIGADKAGTYMYLDPLSPPANRVLGLHGALVVLPSTGNTPYSNPTAIVQSLFDSLGNAQFPGEPWKTERTRVWMFHQVDPAVNQMAQNGADPQNIASFLLTPGKFKPRYFTISGDSGAFSTHNPTIVPSGRIGQPHLIRLLNAGLVTHSPHIHGNHVYVLSVNHVVQENLFQVDTWTVKPTDVVDWLLPFIRPPDIPGDPAAPLRVLLKNELAMVLGGVAQSPLRYPMHCHTEMSQTAAGGNYPQGLVTDFDITGDLDQDFTIPATGESSRSGGDSRDQRFFPFVRKHDHA